jgi:hypothetical protein
LKTADFPATSIDGSTNAILNGGGNLRAYTSSAKTTQLPVEIVSFVSSGTPEAIVYVRMSSAFTGATLYIEADDTETSQPAATGTYGRNNVWQDYAAVLHLQDNTTVGPWVDSTGNGHDGSLIVGTSVPNVATNPLGGVWLDFNEDTIIELASSTALIENTSFTVQSNVNLDQSSEARGVFGNRSSVNDFNWASLQSSRRYFTKNGVTENFFDVGARATLTDLSIALAQNATRLDCYEAGSLLGSVTPVSGGESIAANQPFKIGTYYSDGAPAFRLDGRVGEARVRRSYLSSDWISTEEDNYFSTVLWGTNSAWEDQGGGTTVALTGQSATSGQGSLTVSAGINLAIAGQASASQQGVIAVTTGAGVNVTLSGQAAAAQQGSIVIAGNASVTLGGQESVTGIGAVSIITGGAITVALTGQAAAANQGALSLSIPFTQAISGQASIAGQGAVSVALPQLITLAGQQVESEQGAISIISANIITLNGQETTAAQGVLKLNTGGTWTVEPDTSTTWNTQADNTTTWIIQ